MSIKSNGDSTTPVTGSGGDAGFETIIKPADETVMGSVVLQNDDDFIFTPKINTDYEVHLYLFVDGTTAGGFKWNFTFPTGTTGWNGGIRALNSANDLSDISSEDFAIDLTGSVDTANDIIVPITVLFRVGSTLGPIRLQWAQSVGTGACIVKENSFMVVREIGAGGGGNGSVAQNYTVGVTIDGEGAVPSTGQKGYRSIPVTGTIVSARLLADQSGSAVVDVWLDTFANYPPIDADSITASAPPTISSDDNSEDTTLTGWTIAVTAGDVLGFNLDSITTIERVTLELEIAP